MKKIFTCLSIILAGLFLLGFSSPPVQAGPIVKSGQTIYLDGQIDGDVILFAREVVVNATISGDLIVFAGQADISGQINQDLRVVAGQLNLDALVADDVSVAAGQIEVSPDTVMDKSFLAAAAKIRFNGQAAGPATILAASIDIFPQAKFNQNVKLIYGQIPQVSSQAQINGELIKTYNPNLSQARLVKKHIPKMFQGFKTLTGLFFLERLSALTIEVLIGWLLILLLPQLVKKLVKLSSTHASVALGWGFIFFSLIPLIILLLILTLIGIPVSVVVLLIYIISLSLAKLLAALILGSRLLADLDSKKPYLSLSLGAVILAVLQLVPVFGWLAYFILILYGLGLLVIEGRLLLTRLKKR
ncbi:MAG: hypothetical protein V1810_04160 [Candidatus Beckwithbacteria bacterium]